MACSHLITRAAAPTDFYAPGATTAPCGPSQRAGAVLGGRALMIKQGGAASRTPLPAAGRPRNSSLSGCVARRLAVRFSGGMYMLPAMVVVASRQAAAPGFYCPPGATTTDPLRPQPARRYSSRRCCLAGQTPTGQGNADRLQLRAGQMTQLMTRSSDLCFSSASKKPAPVREVHACMQDLLPSWHVLACAHP